ncbi:ribosome-associated protein [Alteromonadaceae bacterium Bs31]|nr:ribosome-associated protein [Alteromonadaceae bacterium Bs31]
MIDNEELFDEEPVKSRTQVKKEMLALQQLGEKLTELNAAHLATIPLDEALKKAVLDAPKITQRSARKRHFQFIGKLMRAADSEAIQKAYDATQEKQHTSVKQHHQMEQWRDRLLHNQDALAKFIDLFPSCDRQQLRQLIRSSQQETSQQKPPASARKLFRFIRECFESSDGEV